MKATPPIPQRFTASLLSFLSLLSFDLALSQQLSDPDLVQHLISDYLVKAEDTQFTDQRKDMDIVIGDVRRVLKLPAERLRLLEIAAKGAVDRNLDSWRAAQENQARQQAGGLPPEMVEQRLASLGTMHVNNDSADRQDVWKAALDIALKPEELAAWKQAEGTRKTYRTQAMAAMLVAELDRHAGLTLTQCEKLEPLAQKAIDDYLPDIANYTDRNSGIDFRMLMLLLTGAPPDQVQGVLSPDQYGKWQQLTADYRGWWQSIEQNHRTRTAQGGQEQPPVPGGGLRFEGGGRIIIRGGGKVIIK